MPKLSENFPKFLVFGDAGYSRRGRSQSVSVPFIREKWSRSPSVLAPGAGDLERMKKEDEKVQLRIRRLYLTIRIVQMICSYFTVSCHC
jgi:hypothetical protein